MNINQYLLEQLIAHKVDLMRYSESVRTQVLQQLALLAEDIRAGLLLNLPGKMDRRSDRQETLIAQISQTIATAYRTNNQTLDRELLELADISQDFGVKLLNDGFEAEVAGTALTRNDLAEIASNSLIQGAPSADWWAKQSSDLQHRFATEVRLGVMRAEEAPQIVSRVIGNPTGGKVAVDVGDGVTKLVGDRSGGVLGVSKQEATALVRTSVQTVSNNVLKKTYAANQDVLKGRLWVSTLDARTSLLCASLDGGAWDWDGDPLPESRVKEKFVSPPPRHFQCRSVLAPITKSWNELIAEHGGHAPGKIADLGPDVRASMDGEVPTKTNYTDWFSKQSVERQQDILGPGKWKLWKDGRLTFAEMIDMTGRPLTLDQLRAIVAAKAAAS